jgi:cytochrome c-type biogenesis protein CcmF
VLSSVHAFASSAIGPLFFGFICITFLGSLGLLLYRWNNLKAEGQMTSLMSRESFFLFNNLVFMGVLAVCFWGVLFPIISELFTGLKVTVGPPFYKRTTGPLFGGLMLLMGVAPLTAWSASTARTLGKALWKPLLVSLTVPLLGFVLGVRDWIALVALWLVGVTVFVTLYDYGRSVLSYAKQSNVFVAFWKLTRRNRRRYGGYMIHLAVVMMSLGIIGIEFFQTETQGTVAKGGTITLDSYLVTYKSLDEIKAPDGHTSTVATLSVFKDGVYVGDIQPQRDWYPDAEQTMTIPGLRSTLADDLYVILVDWQQIGSAGATFKIYHNPLVIWLWIGSVAFILGTLVAAWPEKDTA